MSKAVSVSRARLGGLLVLAARYALPRPTWAFECVCRAIAAHAGDLPAVERTLVEGLVAAHEPPRVPTTRRRRAWEAAAAALGLTFEPTARGHRWRTAADGQDSGG